MKKNFLSLLFIISAAGMCLSGCEKKENETVDTNPVIENVVEQEVDAETEEVSENADAPTDTDPAEVSDNAGTDIVFDESMMDEPVPKTLDETVAFMRSLPNGQLLSDFMFKVLHEFDQVEFTDVEWTTALGDYITELENTNPTLLEEFYNATVDAAEK